jgi:PAS domain S-box-containing protein
MQQNRIEDYGPAFAADLKRGQTVAVGDVCLDLRTSSPEALRNFARIKLAGFLNVPLIKEERLVAILAIHSHAARIWSPEDVALAEEVAKRTWAAAEQAQAEARLRESEERSRRIVEGVRGYSVFTIDADGRVFDWTPGAAETFGWPAEEIVGKGAGLLCTPEDRTAGVPEHELANAREKSSTNEERWHLRRDGSCFFGNVSVRPLHGAHGDITGFIKIVRDETDRRAVEAERDRALTLLRTLIEAVPGVVYAKDRDGRMLVANHGTTELIGKTPAFYIGKTDAEFLDDPAQARAIMATDRRIMESGIAEQVEEEVHLANATPAIWLSTKAPLKDSNGGVVGLVGSSINITARRSAEVALRELNATLEEHVAIRTGELLASEQRFRAIFDSAFQFMALLAVDGTVLEVNQTAMAWSGITPDEIVQHPFWQAAPMRDNLELQNKIQDEIGRAARGKIARSEHEMRGSGDTKAVIDFSLKPVFDAKGNVVYLIAEGRDVTEFKLAQEQLRQSQKMEAVGQLTGGLAHDFNNLLAAISGSLELLQVRVAQGRLNDLDRYLVAAQGASKRAAALTHRLLAFTRRQTLDPKPTDVNRLIAGMEELVRRTVGPAVKLEVVGTAGLWTTLVDPNQLENALLNLCINARDAMPDGGQLMIETSNKWLDEQGARARDLPPGQYVSLCVSDTGTGMTPEVIQRAFDPFFTTKPIGMGTGLGLSMIYGFVRQSGGQARIYSELGQGALVCLYLPRYCGDPLTAEEPAEPAKALRAEHDETVLVVDDEPIVRMLVTEVLEDLGYTAIEAGDGAAGLQVLQSDIHIDLLVTDVGLPGMNGRQLADAARVTRPSLKVLFITGYAENAVLSHGHLDPGMHVLTKPFAIEALASRIENLITRA